MSGLGYARIIIMINNFPFALNIHIFEIVSRNLWMAPQEEEVDDEKGQRSEGEDLQEQQREDEERAASSSEPPPVELESAAAEDEVEIAAPPESVEEMIADQQRDRDLKEETEEVIETDQKPELEVGDQQREKPQRKRKWGSTRIGKRTGTLAISSDSLKDIVGSVKEVVEETLPEHKVELDYDEEQPESKRIVITQEEEKDESKEESPPTVKRIVVEEPGQEVLINKEPDTASDAVTTEEGLTRCKSVSPARYPVNQVIHVRCLTRPFTVKQLQDLLATFGKFNKKDFWIDNIKTNCLVKYESEEEAEKARNGLHNVKWPSGNPKLLRVDFASQDVLDRHSKGVVMPGSREKENNVEHEHRRKDNVKDEKKVEPRSRDRKEKRRSKSPPKSVDVWPRDREWDKGKSWESGQSPPRREDERERRQRRRSPREEVDHRTRDSGYAGEQKPAKLLDDLFRKTKTTPCIYWLPLTEEEAVIKMKDREMVKKRQEKEKAEKMETLRRLEEEERAVRRRDPFEHDDRVPPPGRMRRRSPTPDRYRRR